MLKTLAAALVAASVLIAPIAASAETAPAAKPATATTTKVTKAKGHKHHVARHHKHRKVVKHTRGHNKTVAVKKTRHGKTVKAHQHSHVAAKTVKAPKVAN